mgnify:FL=1|tara:strand:- start:17574 stop:18713 length:1140 start_codon:yes stop_codon:yes gene_type:complete
MEIKVKAVDGNTQKSKAEIEEQLLKKHEAQQQENQAEEKPEKVEPQAEVKENPAEETPAVEEKTPSSELNDEHVLNFIKERYNKDINSVEELFETKESNVELPEDVKLYFDYKKETGRGIEDFYKLQKNYDDMDEDSVLADYLSVQEEGLDAIDIQDIMDDRFGYDSEEDDEKDIKKKKLAKKRELAKARKFFKEQKDKYKVPLESSGGGLSDEQENNLNAYKTMIEESNSQKEAVQLMRRNFEERTNKVFGDEFKGFEFSVSDDKSILYKPGTAEELKNKQMDFNNFVSKFNDENGLMKDAAGYHRAMSIAMNPEKFAKFFYEQGVAATVDDVARKSKNINMDVRRAPQLSTKNSLKIKAVGDTSSGRGLKIRSIKKV